MEEEKRKKMKGKDGRKKRKERNLWELLDVSVYSPVKGLLIE